MWAKSTTGAGQRPKTTVTATHRAMATTVAALTGARARVVGGLATRVRVPASASGLRSAARPSPTAAPARGLDRDGLVGVGGARSGTAGRRVHEQDDPQVEEGGDGGGDHGDHGQGRRPAAHRRPRPPRNLARKPVVKGTPAWARSRTASEPGQPGAGARARPR